MWAKETRLPYTVTANDIQYNSSTINSMRYFYDIFIIDVIVGGGVVLECTTFISNVLAVFYNQLIFSYCQKSTATVLILTFVSL